MYFYHGLLGDTANLSEAEGRVLKGQFRYLIAQWQRIWKEGDDFQDDLDFWMPRVADDELRGLTLCISSFLEEDHSCTEDQIVYLSDAANDLTIALRLDSSLPPYIGLILAKSAFLTGNYQVAAQQYLGVLEEGLWKDREDHQFLRQHLYLSAATAHEKAGDADEAKRILHDCLKELPGACGVWLRLAGLHTQPPDADYKSAYEALRREVELNPKAGEDLPTSIALTLGEPTVRDGSIKEAIKEYRARNPTDLALTEALLYANWSCFRTLGQKSQSEWVEASWMLWGLAKQVPEQHRRGLYRKAAQTFGAAVESELRDRFFVPFRDHVKRDAAATKLAEKGLNDNSRSRQPSRFGSTHALCNFLVKEGYLTLGPMFEAIDAARRPNAAGILKELSRYMQKQFSALLMGFQWLDWHRLNNRLYNPSKHEVGSLSVEEAEEMHSLCSRFLSRFAGPVGTN